MLQNVTQQKILNKKRCLSHKPEQNAAAKFEFIEPRANLSNMKGRYTDEEVSCYRYCYRECHGFDRGCECLVT
jgi:hypothetical protein